jgi:SnoaL-like domain
MALAETEVELRSWLDRLAIQDLIYRYADGLTRADWKQCESVFAPEAIWESPALGLRYENRAGFIEMLEGTSAGEFMIQTASSPVINLIGSDEAQATTTVQELMRGVTAVLTGELLNSTLYGVYFDDVVRIDGEWKFTHRLYVPIYAVTGALNGDVVTPRSGLRRPV